MCMKSVFYFLAGVCFLTLLASCTPFGTITEAEFTFVNDRIIGGESITVDPVTGQDWISFTLAAPGDRHVVASENGTLLFNAYIGASANPTNNYSYNSGTRTFTFDDE